MSIQPNLDPFSIERVYQRALLKKVPFGKLMLFIEKETENFDKQDYAKLCNPFYYMIDGVAL